MSSISRAAFFTSALGMARVIALGIAGVIALGLGGVMALCRYLSHSISPQPCKSEDESCTREDEPCAREGEPCTSEDEKQRQILNFQSKPKETNTKRQDQDFQTTFRVFLRPVTLEDDQKTEHDMKRETEELVRKAFDVEDIVQIHVRSIVIDSPLKTQIGTLNFSKIPENIKQTTEKHSISSKVQTSAGLIMHIQLDIDFDGLTPFHSGDFDSQSVNIIAVTGLGGHGFQTFKAQNEDYMWLRDQLPMDLPNSRIFSLSYRTKVPGSTSFQSLEDLGSRFRTFLKDLAQKDKTENHPRRLVLIGHSLGGLIIREAMCILFKYKDLDVLELIRGILFFGTPTKGMDISIFKLMVQGQPNEDFLKSFEPDSWKLHRVAEDWNDLSNTESRVMENLEIVWYHETEQTPTPKLTGVEGKKEWKKSGPPAQTIGIGSATDGRPFERSRHYTYPIARNHSDLLKFGRFNDDYTIQVMPMLKKFSKNTNLQPGSFYQNKEQEACLKSLHFLEYDLRSDQIAEALDNTCTWHLEDPKYEKWYLQEKGLLRLKGYRTSGKSTLMKHIVEKMKSQPKLVTMRHFFNRYGVELQRNACGFFRSLMYQFLPSSYSSLDLATLKYKKMSDESLWEPQWMKEFLEKEIPRACEDCKNLRFVILIDALDECSGESKRDVVDFLVNLLSVQRGPQICVSYALLPGVFAESPEIDIASKNGKDIASFVEKKLSILSLKTNFVQKDITRRAKGMFSWAKIACEKVMELHKKGDSVSAIQQAIESLPKDLEYIFLETIKEIKPEDAHESLKLFVWICFAKRSLSVSELQYAIMMTPDMKETSIEDIRKSENFRDQDEMIRAIHHLSAGLAETIESRDSTAVQLIHGSVHGFLFRHGFEELLKGCRSSGYTDENFIKNGYFYLSRSCIRYLSMKERHVWELEGLSRKSIHSFPFLEYAATSWMFHTEQVERAERKTSQDDLLQLLEWPSPKILNSWTEFIRRSHSFNVLLKLYPWPKGTTLLHVLARYGIVSLLTSILNGCKIKGNEKAVEHQTNQCQAADKGQNRTVISSTELEKVNFDVGDDMKRTPLWYAADANEVAAAELLLKDGANPNAEDLDCKTPLYQVARNAGEEMMNVFSQLPVEVAQITEAVLVAVAGNQQHGPKVMRVLLDKRLSEVKITSRVIQAATKFDGAGLEFIRTLIQYERLKINALEDALEGMLKWILEMGDAETTRLFFQKRCLVGIRISTRMFVAAARNCTKGAEITDFLLASNSTTPITKRMIRVAMKNPTQAPKIIEAYVRSPFSTKILTQELRLATQNWIQGEKVTEALRHQRRSGALSYKLARNRLGERQRRRKLEFLRQVSRQRIANKVLENAEAGVMFKGEQHRRSEAISLRMPKFPSSGPSALRRRQMKAVSVIAQARRSIFYDKVLESAEARVMELFKENSIEG